MENNFETKLLQLEDIVAKLENSEISLDEASTLFEDGIKLSGDCRKILENAERKIKTLTECEAQSNNG